MGERAMWNTIPEPPVMEVWDSEGTRWVYDSECGYFDSEDGDSLFWDSLIYQYGPLCNFPPAAEHSVVIKTKGQSIRAVIEANGRELVSGSVDEVLSYMKKNNLMLTDDQAWFLVVDKA